MIESSISKSKLSLKPKISAIVDKDICNNNCNLSYLKQSCSSINSINKHNSFRQSFIDDNNLLNNTSNQFENINSSLNSTARKILSKPFDKESISFKSSSNNIETNNSIKLENNNIKTFKEQEESANENNEINFNQKYIINKQSIENTTNNSSTENCSKLISNEERSYIDSIVEEDNLTEEEINKAILYNNNSLVNLDSIEECSNLPFWIRFLINKLPILENSSYFKSNNKKEYIRNLISLTKNDAKLYDELKNLKNNKLKTKEDILNNLLITELDKTKNNQLEKTKINSNDNNKLNDDLKISIESKNTFNSNNVKHLNYNNEKTESNNQTNKLYNITNIFKNLYDKYNSEAKINNNNNNSNKLLNKSNNNNSKDNRTITNSNNCYDNKNIESSTYKDQKQIHLENLLLAKTNKNNQRNTYVEKNKIINNELNKYKSNLNELENIRKLEEMDKEIEDSNSRFCNLSDLNLHKEIFNNNKKEVLNDNEFIDKIPNGSLIYFKKDTLKQLFDIDNKIDIIQSKKINFSKLNKKQEFNNLYNFETTKDSIAKLNIELINNKSHIVDNKKLSNKEVFNNNNNNKLSSRETIFNSNKERLRLEKENQIKLKLELEKKEKILQDNKIKLKQESELMLKNIDDKINIMYNCSLNQEEIDYLVNNMQYSEEINKQYSNYKHPIEYKIKTNTNRINNISNEINEYKVLLDSCKNNKDSKDEILNELNEQNYIKEKLNKYIKDITCIENKIESFNKEKEVFIDNKLKENACLLKDLINIENKLNDLNVNQNEYDRIKNIIETNKRNYDKELKDIELILEEQNAIINNNNNNNYNTNVIEEQTDD